VNNFKVIHIVIHMTPDHKFGLWKGYSHIHTPLLLLLLI